MQAYKCDNCGALTEARTKLDLQNIVMDGHKYYVCIEAKISGWQGCYTVADLCPTCSAKLMQTLISG